MPVLTSQQRKLLDASCVKGRRASEQAVRAALGSLAVTAERPPAHLSEEDRQLRRGLRAKSRQLGDQGDKLDLLIAECAYEQWHRLLFARFLAENNLLIHPEYRAPVTLEDCEELADSLGEPDGWSVAGRFAAEILPGIFRLDDPCVQLRLAPEGRLALEGIVARLPAEVFDGDDALGWVYQFWQREQKDEVNRSERKVGGADIGPVTQLFTENYMVRFLLENSLGAWWAVGHPESPLVEEWRYLRFSEDRSPAAGPFSDWPTAAADVTVIDPCCGSGHFLVVAFGMLWRMRAEEEGLTPTAAQDAVLRNNLFGLEIDARCVQIAMFAIALQAWKDGGGWRELPVPNVACSGIAVTAPVEEWTAAAGDDGQLETALKRLHGLFRRADSLGTLIDPRVIESSDLWRVDLEQVESRLVTALEREQADPASAVLGHTVAGAARAAALLTATFTLAATNVPYMSRSKQGADLRSFGNGHMVRAKHDLASMMLERILAMSTAVAAVLPQGWTQLSRYEAFRMHLLQTTTLRTVAFLGAGAFSGISGEVVNVLLMVSSGDTPTPEAEWWAIDASRDRGGLEKAAGLVSNELVSHVQAMTLRNPDARIVPEVLAGGSLLSECANSLYGLRTGDGARLIRLFWELPSVTSDWRFHQGTTEQTQAFGGRGHILYWQSGSGVLAQLADEGIASLQGEGAWGRSGVVVSLMGQLPVTRYTGESYDNNCAVVWPKNPDDLAALWAFMTDPSFASSVRMIDRSLKVTNQTLLKVPFDVAVWREVAAANGPLPEPSSPDPRQWLFDGRPAVSTDPLQVGVALLLGYRWPGQEGSPDTDPLADVDGVVCLPSVRGERPAAERLNELLTTSFGGTWNPARVQGLIVQSGSKKKDLESWLRDDFFKSHCQVFENRPFIWQIWDGRKDGFSALVNYHQLDRPKLEKLAYSYLGDWIERQTAGAREDLAGAEERLAAARVLQQKLELILYGEPPYDIYVRWKSLSEQPIGWEPDLNDGVRLNVRPFVEAGVLRSKFNVTWDKDRGKNPDGSERINDVHYTNAEKQAGRGRSA